MDFSHENSCCDASVFSPHLFGQSELQQAALSQGRLQDFHQLHWLTGRQARHQLQELVHKTVLEVRQLGQKQPEGGTKHRQ